MKKAYLNWSSGKDAAYSLFLEQQAGTYSIDRLVTSLNSENSRVSMHGLRRDLLFRQADAVGIPLKIISLPGQVPMSRYNEIMEKQTQELKAEGFTHSIFGDIFLEDLKEYREKQFSDSGIQPVFPLWKKNTGSLMQDFLTLGFKAITVSVNARILDRSFCGRIIDQDFLKDLPKGVDPAGEHGEYHSFVFDGPNFSSQVPFKKGEVSQHSFPRNKEKEENCFSQKQEDWDTSFYYCDLL